MEYRTLGSSGVSVSTLALGTMTFGTETDEAGSHAQLDQFFEAGGNLVDTADVYSNGVSEEIIGRWLAKQSPEVREHVVLATKGRFATGPGPNQVGLSRRHLARALDASLDRLGVDTIDLYQVHAWDPHTPIEETLAFLDAVVRAGKVHYIGLSNFTGWQIQKAVDVADMHALVRPVTVQPQYNLLAREVEWEIVPVCEAEWLGLLPWSPLGGGWLTGKYHRDERPTGSTRLGENPERGVEAYDRRAAHERTWDVLGAVEEIARSEGSRWPRWRSPGWSTGPRSAPSSSAPAPKNNSPTTSAPPACTSPTTRSTASTGPATPPQPTTPTAAPVSRSALDGSPAMPRPGLPC